MIKYGKKNIYIIQMNIYNFSFPPDEFTKLCALYNEKKKIK